MKRVVCILLTIVMLLGMAPASLAANGRWKDYGNNQWAYQFTDGSWAYGWQEIGGSWYYFGSDGWMKTGWQEIGGTWYYFYDSGLMAANTTIDGYYLSASGAMENKTVGNDHWVDYGGGWWAYQLADGSWVYGWREIDGSWYYFDGGWMVSGWREINGSWYYFDGGAMAVGWKDLGGSWYYFDANGIMAASRTLTIDGKQYTFLADGRLAENETISGDSELTRENILKVLDRWDPDGAFIVRHSDQNQLLYWFGGAETIREGIDSLGKAVHEQCHDFCATPGGVLYNSYQDENIVGAKQWIYIGNGQHIEVKLTDTFPSTAMVDSIPEALRNTFRFNTYVNVDWNDHIGSNVFGAYGLLDEFTAYYWGFLDEQLLQGYNAELGLSTNSVTNTYLAYAEFRYYILHYLLFAWDYDRDVYNGIVNNKNFRRAFSAIDDAFGPLADNFRYGWWTVLSHHYGYNELMAEMEKPEYVEMARILHS